MRTQPILSRPGESMFRMSLRAWLVLASVLGAAPQVQAQYTVQFLPPPTEGQPGGGQVTPYALNNQGQVFGRNFWGNVVSGTPDRGPALWTNGVGAALPLPAGFHWYDAALGFLNDAGVVVSTVQFDSGTYPNVPALRPIVWQNGAATVVPVPMALSDCAARFNNFALPPYAENQFDVWPLGLNGAGHILISACNSLWIVDSAGAVLTAGPPPAFLPQLGLQPVYFVSNNNASYGNHLNDADRAAAENGVLDSSTSTHPGILDGLSIFSALPLDHGYAQSINNRNQVFAVGALVGQPVHCFVWNGTALVDLGDCGMASLNNLGQLAFVTSPPGPQLHLYRSGAVTTITVPAEIP